jgi:hypothetical protein
VIVKRLVCVSIEFLNRQEFHTNAKLFICRLYLSHATELVNNVCQLVSFSGTCLNVVMTREAKSVIFFHYAKKCQIISSHCKQSLHYRSRR